MAPQQRRDRSRRLTVVAAAVAASVTLAAGSGFAVGVDPGPPAPTAPAPAAPAPATPAPAVPAPLVPAPAVAAPLTVPPAPVKPAVPPFGAFLDSGPLGVARMAQLSHWLGGTELKVAHTYLPGDRWRDIEGAPGFLDVWAQWRRDKADRTLVLNVPMLERNEEYVPDVGAGWLLREGAAGAFDQHFKALAERLVALKVPDTVIVLGWEMNGTTYRHRCGPDPESWKKYWDRIVTTMRAVPGQKFRFDFSPSRGRDAVPWTECYPGDRTVDIIGMDSYDQPAGESFEEQVKEPYGLQQHVDFAKSHGKPISYPEWGLFRNGDNGVYMQRMLAWIDEHKPLYNTLTDYCPHGVWQCSANPRSSQVYRTALYGIPDQPAAPVPTPSGPAPKPAPTPTSTPTPTHYKPPANCSPVDLGDWVEYWLGGKLCVRFDWWSRSS
ncbi:glycosyl hydrolase [Streptomyces sp. FXJ1.172]|uniref:glycoside hydrolase family 26 protein n=1 Tax=Streptomyces sp. FXJ1.172 TaxID=710705 RepID=UPI0007CFA70E|nr:glycosyl hydrolase [Streptomyces sp. FXJ1.172]WEO97324.1 glycosyl hydrolase [Streptomyces sp. FXJ1.172]